MVLLAPLTDMQGLNRIAAGPEICLGLQHWGPHLSSTRFLLFEEKMQSAYGITLKPR
jgi:hypothetical protein